jgi:hypothetical protein
LVTIGHPLSHHTVVLIFPKVLFTFENILEELLLVDFRLLLVLDFLQEVIVASLSFDASEFLCLFGVLHQLIILQRVGSIIQFIQEFEEF